MYGADEDILQADSDGLSLQAGQFTWLEPAEARAGSPVTMLVNLSEQRGYLYRDGRRIAVTTVSTGLPGHDTPTGVFPITQKEKVHHSNKYNNAPMPYMVTSAMLGTFREDARTRAEFLQFVGQSRGAMP